MNPLDLNQARAGLSATRSDATSRSLLSKESRQKKDQLRALVTTEVEAFMADVEKGS